MENFMIAVNAVVPFIIYIAFGYAVRSFKVVSEDFLRKLNQMVFKCFFPILMFNNFSQMDLGKTVSLHFLIFFLGAFFVVLTLSWVLVPRFVKENPRRGVIIQALFRSNAILFALPLAESVAGQEGYMLASLCVSFTVPLYNVFAVVILEYYSGKKPSPLELLKKVVTNPLILGALAGVVFLLLPFDLPAFVAKPVKAFADLTTPLSLFILGGLLHFSAFGKNMRTILITMGLKLVVVPLILVLLSIPYGFTGIERFVMLIFFATPVAVSSYTMAANMGGDDELAGQFVALSTALSLFTIFTWIYVLKSLGLI